MLLMNVPYSNDGEIHPVLFYCYLNEEFKKKEIIIRTFILIDISPLKLYNKQKYYIERGIHMEKKLYEINSKIATYNKNGSDNGRNTPRSVLEERLKQQKIEKENKNDKS